jgi:hypothetical protein
LARFTETAPEDELVNAALAQVPADHSGRPRILVSLQWGLAELHYGFESFNGVMVQALEQAILASNNRFSWLLRLHPVQMRGHTATSVQTYLERTFGACSSVEWLWPSAAALPALLRSVSAHVTDSSSVVVEAARFGVPSAMLNPLLAPGGRLERLCAAERETGLAEVVPQDPTAIIKWLEGQVQRGRVPLQAEGGRQAWTSFLKRLMA